VSTLWNNLPIRAKLVIAFSTLLVIFGISLAIDYVFIARQAAMAQEFLARSSPMLDAVARSRRGIAYMEAQTLGFLSAPSRAAAEENLQNFNETAKRDETYLRTIQGLGTSQDRDLIERYAAWFPRFESTKVEGFGLIRAGNKKAGAEKIREVPSSAGETMLTALYNQVRKRSDAAQEAAIANADSARFVTILAAVVSLGLGIVITLALGNGIARRLRQVTSAMGQVVNDEVAGLVSSMQRLASGDFTARVETRNEPLAVRGKDEPALLADAYNELLAGIKKVGVEFSTTTQMLSELVARVKNSVEQVSSAAVQIAEGSANLSQRTEEQASGLEETAASMEEFTATVKQNAHNAEEANALGTGAQEQARKSGEVMHDVVATMEKINASSQKIVEIISVIDGIAFQTNILALNAAVEAARAGEQGRGFAVVAGEVRSLAQRSAAAAKEIKSLIDDTVSKVSDGSALVKQAGSTMGELVDSVQRVTAILSDIAAASREQSSGIDQVNKAITQMDEVTQQNAALVEEAAAAAGSLEEQARALLETVRTFKVDASAAASRPAKAAAVQREPLHKPPVSRPVHKAALGKEQGGGKTAVALASASEDDWETF
jgi:methyl-accepting chemotaxis protein